MPRFEVGDTWPTLAEAKAAALRFIVSRGESWRSYKDSKNKHWVVVCKSRKDPGASAGPEGPEGAEGGGGCPFRIRVNRCRDGWKLTVHRPHTCPALTHQNFRNAHSTTLIAGDPYYRALIAADPTVKAAVIRDHEWDRYANRIPYLQAWRALVELRKEVLGAGGGGIGVGADGGGGNGGAMRTGAGAPLLPSREEAEEAARQDGLDPGQLDPALFQPALAHPPATEVPMVAGQWRLAEVTAEDTASAALRAAASMSAPTAVMGAPAPAGLPALPPKAPGKKRGRKPKPKDV